MNDTSYKVKLATQWTTEWQSRNVSGPNVTIEANVNNQINRINLATFVMDEKLKLNLTHHLTFISIKRLQVFPKFKISSSAEMSKMQNKKLFTDLTLLVDGQTIDVHKIIIASASPVILEELQESGKQEVEITGSNFEIVNSMVEFLYTNSIENIETISVDLFKLAHRYKINDLKDAIESYMIKTLTADSVIDCLTFANEFERTTLKSVCLDYFVNNAKQIVSLSSWQEKISKACSKSMFCEEMAEAFLRKITD